MHYRQAKRILDDISRHPRATGKAILECAELAEHPLPRLGGYAPGSPEIILWRMASDPAAAPGKRLIALRKLLMTREQRQAVRELDNK